MSLELHLFTEGLRLTRALVSYMLWCFRNQNYGKQYKIKNIYKKTKHKTRHILRL